MEKSKFIKEVVPLRPKLINYAFKYMKDKEDAEDVVQEIFLKLFEMRSVLDNYKSVHALSFTMTKNLCLNKIRDSKHKFNTEYNVAVQTAEPGPHMQLENKDNVAHVKRIIDTLPKLQQAILKMRHVDGLTVDEIAELIGSSPEAIRVNLSRGRKQVIGYFNKMENL